MFVFSSSLFFSLSDEIKSCKKLTLDLSSELTLIAPPNCSLDIDASSLIWFALSSSSNFALSKSANALSANPEKS